MKTFDDILTITLILMIVFTFVRVGFWVYDLFYGDWLDEPVMAAEPEPMPKYHSVEPGDSLWSIYQTYYKGHDWEEVRFKLGQANNLKNDQLRAYTTIKLVEVN